MIINQLLRRLSDLTAFSEGALDHTARALRIAGLIPNAGRGGIAPDMNAQHLANYLIGLGAADSPARAGVRAAEWSDLAVLGDQVPAFAPPSTRFGKVLAMVLERQDLALLVDELRINRLWPEATFILKDDGRRFVYGLGGPGRRGAIQAAGYRSGSGAARVEATFTGAVLQQLGAFLIGDKTDDAEDEAEDEADLEQLEVPEPDITVPYFVLPGKQEASENTYFRVEKTSDVEAAEVVLVRFFDTLGEAVAFLDTLKTGYRWLSEWGVRITKNGKEKEDWFRFFWSENPFIGKSERRGYGLPDGRRGRVDYWPLDPVYQPPPNVFQSLDELRKQVQKDAATSRGGATARSVLWTG